MRSMNAIELLNLIREHGRVSRASLAKISKLSKPTVSELVSFLEQRNLVREGGEGTSTAKGGKKPTFIEFNAAYGSVAGVEILPDQIRFSLCDLTGKVLSEVKVDPEGKLDGDAVIKILKQGFRRLVKSAGVDWSDVQTLAVAAPGIVDCHRGIVQETENVFGWRDLDIRSRLAAEFNIPIYVDNDVNMAALAELNSGWGKDYQNFVLIRINTGIGAGIVLNGKLYHGSHWAAGEIGHMLLNIGQQPPTPDPRGYLESMVASDQIAKRVQKLAGRNAQFRSAIAKKGEFAAALDAANDGSQEALELIADLANHIGGAVANVIATYDPDLVILVGDSALALIDEIRDIATRVIPWPVEVRPSLIGDAASLQGSVIAALNMAYEQISRSFDQEEMVTVQ